MSYCPRFCWQLSPCLLHGNAVNALNIRNPTNGALNMSHTTFLVALSFLGPGDTFLARLVCRSWSADLLVLSQLATSTKRLVASSPLLRAVSRFHRGEGRPRFDSVFWAAYYGHTEVIKWAFAQVEKNSLQYAAMRSSTMSGAATGGQVAVLELERELNSGWTPASAIHILPEATAANALNVLEWWWQSLPAAHRSPAAVLDFRGVYSAFKIAAMQGCRMGSLECLRWLSEHGTVFEATSCQAAANSAQLSVLVWLGDVCLRDHYICGEFVSSLRRQAACILAELEPGSSCPQYVCINGSWDKESKKAIPAHFELAPVESISEKLED